MTNDKSLVLCFLSKIPVHIDIFRNMGGVPPQQIKHKVDEDIRMAPPQGHPQPSHETMANPLKLMMGSCLFLTMAGGVGQTHPPLSESTHKDRVTQGKYGQTPPPYAIGPILKTGLYGIIRLV